jgi:hypothetical protein
MSTKKGTTLRLNMPQWQGGNRHDYYFGSQLLAWLAPPASGPVETVPVSAPKPVETLEVENGILGRKALLRQARAARKAIEKHRPDRIVTLGGGLLSRRFFASAGLDCKRRDYSARDSFRCGCARPNEIWSCFV